jgi:hypothetical protein
MYAVELQRCQAPKQLVIGHRPRCRGHAMRVLSDFIFLILFIGLLVLWLVLWAALHLAGGAIHLLLIIAVVSLIVHLFRGRRVA